MQEYWKFKRGSEWRKWDLHIHSDTSDGKMTCKQIVDKAIENGIDVIALTDHHTFKNIDTIRGRLTKRKLTYVSVKKVDAMLSIRS
jgi:predicted metal-dependent phosphoesterase TrpH